MKNLMITAAASALMLGMTACSQSSDDIEMGESNYDQTETAEMAGTDASENNGMMDADADAQAQPTETVYLASGELSADELIGSKVIGVDGEEIANVDDLLVNASGEVESVIFKSGDFLDMAGKKGALPFEQIDLTMNSENEPRFTVGMTEDAIQNVAEFEQDGMNDYRLVSEMIGTNAKLMNADETERIKDVIITKDGSVSYAVIADPMMMDEPRQLAFNRITVEQGDGGNIVIDASADEIEALPVFKYKAEEARGSSYGDTGMSDDESTDMSQDIMQDDPEMDTPQ
ncbi:PRC-barrel domain-containing protein [Henriciella aquimarina]|uniref:PRC-barrel domain-containing protein n=1 Tax=Henriciella aquimarina TaxID=545261 RepID=UPI000A03E911|nr:PRC-barrel domain-containing protein [Henriciella aquimarina]